MANAGNLIFADEIFSLEACLAHQIPGYLILRLRQVHPTFSGLSDQVAQQLGLAVAKISALVEGKVAAETVYVMRFGEESRQIHFHIFPRTRRMDEAFRSHHSSCGQFLNGPLVFEWARNHFKTEQESLINWGLDFDFKAFAECLYQVMRSLSQ